MTDFVLAIDQGTTSTRAIIFDSKGAVVSKGQLEHQQIFPHAGWVEHDPMEIWNAVREVVGLALTRANLTHEHIAAVGVTNQRETTVVWDKFTGEPVYNAIVWQDTRTQHFVSQLSHDGGDRRFAHITGLPLATYFSAPKVRWILDHVPGAADRAAAGDLLMGTMDSWILWQMTGGVEGGVHVTDVTNASRTMLMNLKTLQWDDEMLEVMGIPRSMLATIKTSSEIYGYGRPGGLLPGVPLCGNLGDQHAATFGQCCFEQGSVKNTYGTGNFMLMNTGNAIVESSHGLLTTVAYQLGGQDPVYALEGSIAVTGSLVQWLRDNLGLISSSGEVESLAASVADAGGAYIVPAFSGLFAPYWRPDARGVMVGLTRYVNKAHLARAALEATAFQTAEVLEAMQADSGVALTELRVDGGMTVNAVLMQIQADVLGVDVVRPQVLETTALGAAYAAGLAAGFWTDQRQLTANWAEGARWQPQLTAKERERGLAGWRKAVQRSLDWADPDAAEEEL